MKKNNLVTLLGIAFVVALVATGIFYGLFVNKLSSSSGTGKEMIVAAKALKAGTVITAVDVKRVPWPGATLPKGTYGTVQEVEGKTLFDGLSEDEPVLASRLAGANGEGSAGSPAGMRAVSVHVSDSTGVIELLRAGHHVDVQVARKFCEGADVRTALQNLKVISVHPQLDQSSQGHSLPVVTVLAKPAEADVLAAADAGARVRLALRNSLDEDTKGRTAINLEGVMRSAAPLQ